MSQRVLRQDLSSRSNTYLISSQNDRRYGAYGWVSNFTGVLNELDLWMIENTTGVDNRLCYFELWSSKLNPNYTPDALLATATTVVDLSTLDGGVAQYKTIRGFNYRISSSQRYFLVAYASSVQGTPCAAIGVSNAYNPMYYGVCYSSDKVTWTDFDIVVMSGKLYQYTAPFPQSQPGSPVAT